LGGTVVRFGKPHKKHFQACIRKLVGGLPKERFVHVGDSMHHDIAGANAAGVDSLFAVGDVHRQELGSDLGSLSADEISKKVFEKQDENCDPKYYATGTVGQRGEFATVRLV
jgi:FMN phosphatase YigB (HAD superfamily)